MTDSIQDPGSVTIHYANGTVETFNLPNKNTFYFNLDGGTVIRFQAYPANQETGPLNHHYINFGQVTRFETSW